MCRFHRNSFIDFEFILFINIYDTNTVEHFFGTPIIKDCLKMYALCLMHKAFIKFMNRPKSGPYIHCETWDEVSFDPPLINLFDQ